MNPVDLSSVSPHVTEALKVPGTVAHALFGAGLLAIPGYAAYRGARHSAVQYDKLKELQRFRERELSTPMPDMSVKEAYAAFAKTAENDPLSENFFSQTLPRELLSGASGGLGRGLGEVVGDVFIRTPVSELSKMVKKKFVTEPRHQAALHQARTNDDILSSKPDHEIMNAHGTLARMAPSLAEDPNFVRGYLRSAVMSGGIPDLPTIRLLLDSEKLRQQAKGKNIGP